MDNVLLSEDGKNTFLCDFGESERLDPYGFSPSQGNFNNNSTLKTLSEDHVADWMTRHVFVCVCVCSSEGDGDSHGS